MAQSRRMVVFGFALAALVLALPGAAAAQYLGPVNLALAKPARQSSILADGVYGGDAWRAVDNNLDGNFWDGSVTHTDYEGNPWWEVDLGEVRQIGRIEIANRTDCCGDRLSSLMVIVADFPILDSDITDFDVDAYPGVMRTFVPNQGQAQISVPINRSGRYVRLALDSPNYLSLAEVQVIEAENAARGRTATQSSTTPGGEASRAVDGFTAGYFSSGSVSSTAVQTGASWSVDLGLLHDIREIDVWSTNADCCSTSNPRPQINVYVSTLPFTTPFDASLKVATVDQGAPAIVNVDKRGRYVAVELAGTDALSLAEVQVWPWARGSVGGHVFSSGRSSSGNYAEYASIDLNKSFPFTNYNSGDQPFWDLDLGSHRYLETIKLWNNATETPMPTFHLFASDNPFFNGSQRITDIQTLIATPGVSHWIGRGAVPVTAISVMRQARFVRVQMEGTGKVQFREAEIATTEGFVIGSLVVEDGLRVNGSVSPFEAFASPPDGTYYVDPPERRMMVAGHFPRPNTTINVYAFNPNASGAGGTYSLFAQTTTGTTPELTGYASGPQYPFNIPDVFFPGPSWLTGGIGAMMVSADDNYGFTPTPIRSINDDGSEHVYWPDIRFVSAHPTPDETIDWGDGSTDIGPTASTYLDKPMSTNTVAGYPATSLIPSTVAAFKSKYGITASSSIHAGYYNAGDLGIGRDMYCRKPTGYTVCLVDNWAVVSSNGTPTFGDPVGAGGPHASLAATVVMVYPNFSGTTGYIPPAFGAYDRNGNRLNNIALDKTGARTQIPNNCMTCHGGSGTSGDGKGNLIVKRAWFLPFDLSAFLDRGSYKLADQQAQFSQLNNSIIMNQGNNGTTAGIAELIRGWYPTVNGVQTTTFNASFVPPGWSKLAGDTKVYTDVIKPYCRTCHIAQETPAGIDFRSASTADDLRAAILADVCSAHRMPHAQQTMQRFWTSGARAQLLGFFARGDLVSKCDH